MTHRAKPLPSDFRDFVQTHSSYECCKHYGIGPKTFRRWCIEAGVAEMVRARQGIPLAVRERAKLNVPTDFREHAAKESTDALCKRYGLSAKTISRFRHETGIKAPPRVLALKPIPRGFAAMAPTMYRNEIAKQFGVGDDTAQRWADEAGVTFRPWHRRRTGLRTALAPQADVTLAGRAASFLQRRVSVYRASVLDRKLDGYVVDGRKMSAEDMIAMAERKGFDPREWARI